MSFVSSPRPIYLRIDDSQIYRRRPQAQQLPHRRLDVIRNLRSSGMLKPASLDRRILRRRRYIHFTRLPVGFHTREGVVLEGESS